MQKRELVEILKKLLETKADLDFLLGLDLKELELLVVILRDRLGQEKK